MLRRNIRIIYARTDDRSAFATSTFGCHHIGLVNTIAKLWNQLASNDNIVFHRNNPLTYLPELPQVDSNEHFGLVSSEHASLFSSLFDIKKEVDDDDDLISCLVPELHEDQLPDMLLQIMCIDQSLVLIPEPHLPSVMPTSTAALTSVTYNELALTVTHVIASSPLHTKRTASEATLDVELIHANFGVSEINPAAHYFDTRICEECKGV